ncbi:hypothetical protein [Bathymodiolus platifrons methanotrophic gill symbiont]|uniref:hypothetical protein n=1 Tax=Bathymodiolus platifrons methanotrophic gill symbiont TaxID=113268 RepID=UPI001C8E90B0|nr:hypothetical protein [Bathymodiolus platifrons methanotrophic gill symbiont]
MNSESLFSMALGLQSPWKVEEIIFSNDNILEQSGSRYFCESLFWASQPKQAAKT